MMFRTGHGKEIHFRRLSSIGNQMESVALTIRLAQHDRLTAFETGGACRLSDQLSDSVELAITELLSAVRHLSAAAISKLD